jgi:signal transduction histidine kinase
LDEYLFLQNVSVVPFGVKIALLVVILVAICTSGLAYFLKRKNTQLLRSAIETNHRMMSVHKLKSIQHFTQAAAHDINNFLTVVINSATLLVECERTPEETQFLQTQLKAAFESGKRLVAQFSEFTQEIEPSIDDVDLPKLIEGAVNMVFLDHQPVTTFDFNEGIKIIKADSDQLLRVFTNLLMNAQQALTGNPDAEITISSRRIVLPSNNDMGLPPGTYLQLDLGDNGVGIPAELHDQIFKTYFTTKPDGHGIGLARARLLIRMHGGDITFTSHEGVGTTFHIFLPEGQSIMGF